MDEEPRCYPIGRVITILHSLGYLPLELEQEIKPEPEPEHAQAKERAQKKQRTPQIWRVIS